MIDRYLVQNSLNYTASEVHASIGPLFNPTLTPELKAGALAKYYTKIQYVNDHLVNGKDFLVGDSFTIADAYLYITLSWVGYVGADISPYKNVTAYYEKIKALPKVVAAHALMATSPTHTI